MTETGDIRHVVTLSSNLSNSCRERECTAKLRSHEPDAVANHYVKEHGYRILHVGQETSHDNEGRPWHSTVFVLGTMADRQSAGDDETPEEYLKQK
jgi:hypothetical protein